MLSKDVCIALINAEQCFEAIIEDAFTLKIESYSFFICTAIHAGHDLRPELREKCALNDKERLYEEDPHTEKLIVSMPITLIAHDSRYEYDLNRKPEECIYETAWGKDVWQAPLSVIDKALSLAKHQAFYAVLQALITKIQTKYGSCIVYDIHSYNYMRMEKNDTPVFNIGTEQLNTEKWGRIIKHWVKTLNACNLPNLNVRAAADEVFYGRGYLAGFVKQHFEKTLVLPTEVKKVFMDEESGDVFPLVFSELKEAFKQILLGNALYFSKRYTNKKTRSKNALLSSTIEPAILELDKKLYQLCKGIETLTYINPKNLVRERRRFYAKNFNYTPNFTYNQLDINPFEFREKLYRLPVDKITDVTIQQFYRDVIDSYATKIDLIASVGTEKFLYNSLRYYGEPSENDIESAQFLLFASEFENIVEETIDAEGTKEAFVKALDFYKIKCKLEITDKIIASAMVNNAKKTILINKSIKVNPLELNGLIHHELGVHMVTTVNSELQKLRVFKLGLPGNTWTQEGLAILSEYQSGNLQLPRLKTLALRVLAARLMVKNYDFTRTFKILTNDFELPQDTAFKITARVYRGGGFTKDYLYLRGLKDALKFYKQQDISALFIGKTSFTYLKVIDELIARKIALPPKHLPYFMQQQSEYQSNPILDYLVDTIR